MQFDSYPKVELHLHLDCSLSFDVVSRLHRSITRDQFKRDFIAPPLCRDLPDFLTRARRGVELMQSEEALRLVTLDLFDQLQHDHVIYAEIRFAPLLHTERGLAPEHVVEIVSAAVHEGRAATGIEARLILCTLRHFTAGQSMETVELAARFHGETVAAVDIAGSEGEYSLQPHVAAFEVSIKKGIPRTAHAGESRGSESVWETLSSLRPHRIGHGIRSIEDQKLVNHLREQHVHLEVCPSSNVQTRTAESIASHPVDELHRKGVSVGINTDARTITNITLGREYHRLADAFGWDGKDFLQCNLNAIHAAFAGQKVIAHVEEHLREGYR
jgi:adenosine deaminase